MLDLRYNSDANFYQAPLHIKANGGIFLIDDFGRQLCSPKELLNRWIVPLENRVRLPDAGVGQEVPGAVRAADHVLDQPRPAQDLVDDAFLRRIRHKVEIEAPDRGVYEKIFNDQRQAAGHEPCPEAVDYLYERYYIEAAQPAGQRLPRFAGDGAVDLPIQKTACPIDARSHGRSRRELHL